MSGGPSRRATTSCSGQRMHIYAQVRVGAL
jgi:hypothetical protein